LSEEELAIIAAIADAEDNGDPGLDGVARAMVPQWSDDRFMRQLLHLHDAGLVEVNAKGSPRIVQIRIVGTTYTGRSAVRGARPAPDTIDRVLNPEEQRDIDVFVRLLRAAIGETEQHRPGPLDGATTGAVDELRADLETLTAQLGSPRPKRSVVRAILVGIGTVTPSVVGSAATQLAAQLSS
jgi:hypothetical protein